MAGKATVGAAVLGALAGAVAGGVAVGTVSGGAPGAELEAARAEVAALRGRVETLEAARPSSSAPASAAAERIESQERRIRALEEAAAAPPPRDDRETEPSGEAARRKEIEERLQELARRTDEAARRLAEAKRGEAAGERAPGKDDPRQVFLDRSKSEDERVAALTRVRDARGIDRAIVDAAVELFRASGRPESRERILRDLHGTRDAEVRRLFLEALRSDADEGVRVRAAGDIDTFAEEAEVRTALDAARLGDASEKVRKAALETLRKD